MKLLLDQGLPRSAAFHLRTASINAMHVGEMGLATASDAAILDVAREDQRVVVTLDADFVLSGAIAPSVIRIRIEGLRAERLASLLVDVLKLCEGDLGRGAMVSVTRSRVSVRGLPARL